ncbi:MAG TPA: helix-turn-helix transcriptional regulator, partial [Pseudonocardia sp.]|nr:helix-turn-helix transcriptional regulator [Pseudonocardia sp.]
MKLERGGGPVLAKKRLATALRELRENSGQTLERVAGELLISVSKLSRLEKGQGVPQQRDVRDLINFYGIASSQLGEDLMRWARDGRRRGWWEEYNDVLSPEQDDYIAYETEATVNLAFTIPHIHGLLQSEKYSRAMLSAFGLSENGEEFERLAETRSIRQQNLDARPGLQPLELRVVLHEVCLTSHFQQSAEVRTEQLQHLLDVSDRENVEVRVLRADSEPHRAGWGMWQHFSFGEDIDRDVVFLESPTGFTYID